MDRRTDGYVFITSKTECFLSVVVELTEHTKGSLQSSDDSKISPVLTLLQYIYTCLILSTVSPLILILLRGELKVHVCKVFVGRRIIACQYLGKALVFLYYMVFFLVAHKFPYDDESSEFSGLAKIERIIFS